jgi:diguanylate cyclase (GGDEF)-like protein/PAS domain S-box-containing protein
MTEIRLVHAYEPILFAGSLILPAFAAYVTLRLLGRARRDAAAGAWATWWLVAASAAMGVGIWSMHFTGMLALRLPARAGYDPLLTFLSMVIAVVVSLLALAVVRRNRVPVSHLCGAGVLMGAAIAGMHYTGMAAMVVPGEMSYRAGLVLLSVAIAVLASLAALGLFLRHRGRETATGKAFQAVASAVMGLAVAGMHYTGMAALRFQGLEPGAGPPGGMILTDGLALGVGGGSLVILGVGLLAATVDRRLRGVYDEDLRRRERRQEALLAEISDVVTLLDEDGTILYESPSIRHVFGYEPEELVGRTGFDIVHPEDRDELRRTLGGDGSLPDGAATLQYRLRAADGTWRMVESTAVLSDHPELDTVVVTRDITGRMEAQTKYRAIFRTSPSPVIFVREGRFEEVNAAFLELHGLTEEEVIGRTPPELGVWVDPGELERVRDRVLAGHTVRNREVRLRDADGEVFHALLSASVTELAGERYEVAFVQDIRERKRYEEELEHQVLHDGLTGLPNRTLFQDRLEHALERADRDGSEVAVLFLDVDRFKAVNDSLGHTAGDEVLRAVATRLTEVLRGDDTVARLGGDEFAILLEHVTSLADIEAAVSRIRGVFDPPFRVDDNEFTLTASVGAARSGTVGGRPEELVRLADAAMYRVKGPGSTRFHVYDPEQDRGVTERLQREAALERALEAGSLTAHYQPVYELATGEIVATEALVRWEDPERGLVSPARFIPIAEESGLIVPLGREMLRQSLRQAAEWVEAGLVEPDRFRMHVNLSAREYQEEDLVEAVETAVEKAGVTLSLLTLEITETVAVLELDRLESLRDRGLRVAIDDFGTGYSSLQYLLRLRADELKVDGSFIAALGRAPREESLVKGILLIAREMGIEAVAEGVETEEQLRWLREAGCPRGQGFHLARPAPAAEITRWLAGAARPV